MTDLEGWKSVGDIAYLDDEGYLYICDRKKDMIISGGVNIDFLAAPGRRIAFRILLVR